MKSALQVGPEQGRANALGEVDLKQFAYRAEDVILRALGHGKVSGGKWFWFMPDAERNNARKKHYPPA